MKITFIGATHEVTGSCTLLENGGRYYLVDKGMEQGVDLFENVPLPVAPEEISAVFITHAHIDHTGMLPKLYKDGYRGPVYATSATCSLRSHPGVRSRMAKPQGHPGRGRGSGAPVHRGGRAWPHAPVPSLQV